MLIVDIYLNTITLLEFSLHLCGWFGMQMQFFAVRSPDVKVLALNAQHFALDGLDAPPCDLIGLYAITFPMPR